MNENAPTIKATKRDRVGSRYAKRLREQGHLPAIVYGHGEEPLSIAVDARDAVKHIKLGEKVFKLAVEGQGEELVLLRDLQYDYLGTNLVHADFSRVDLAEKVTAHVHITLKGDAKGLKQGGAVLTHPVTEITVECALRDLPDHLVVNIAELDADHTIFARDIELPKGVTLASSEDDVIAQIVMASKAAMSEEEADAESGAAEPEITRQKGDDE